MSLFDPSPLEPFLAKLVSRSRLSEAEQRAILGLPAQPHQIQTNHDFVRLGERVEHCCFVVDGLVGRFGQNREGNRQITAVHVATDMVDLHSVVAPEAASALQALAVTTILRVPHGALRDAARRHPAIAEAFWRECVIDAAVLAEWVVNLGRRDARSRLAHLLCEIACRTEGAGRRAGSSFEFPATQAHIADMLGLTPVHVNRTLQGLKKEQVVTVQSRQVHVHDWDRLVRIGDFDPDYLHIARVATETPPEVVGHRFRASDIKASWKMSPAPG
jgi:CRP-like cAMP-binding protein